jgi:hypothetical protein
VAGAAAVAVAVALGVRTATVATAAVAAAVVGTMTVMATVMQRQQLRQCHKPLGIPGKERRRTNKCSAIICSSKVN